MQNLVTAFTYSIVQVNQKLYIERHPLRCHIDNPIATIKHLLLNGMIIILCRAKLTGSNP